MEDFYNGLLILTARINISIMLLPIVVAIFIRKEFNKPLHIFLIYCLVTLAINLLEQAFIWGVTKYYEQCKTYLVYWNIGDTNFLQILYYLKDFIFLGWFYSLLVPKQYNISIKWIAALLSLVATINYLFIEGYNVYGTFNPAADAIFSFALPAFYLWFMYRENLSFPIKKNPYFWISFGLIFTNLIGLFLYLVGDTIYGDDFILFAKISIGRNIFDMISQMLLAIGFWHSPYAKYVTPKQ